MNTRLQRIANDLETDVYKDPMHGHIAKSNFIYGVKQHQVSVIESFKKWLAENSKITESEENRIMLSDLLDRLEE